MLFLIVKFLVATINDSPCFVKIAIFSQQSKAILIELPCFVLCVMIKAGVDEGLSALLDDDW